MNEKPKKYKIKPSRGQLKAMRKAWKDMQDFEGIFYMAIRLIEDTLAFKTGISDIEFWRPTKCMWCKKEIFEDGEFAGIGTFSRSMELIHREQLEPKES
jgi:hypothetical protein